MIQLKLEAGPIISCEWAIFCVLRELMFALGKNWVFLLEEVVFYLEL